MVSFVPKKQLVSPARAVFDLRGGGCAWCILKIRSFLKEMESGDLLEVLVSDPATVEDLAAVLAAGPDRLVKSAVENGFNRIYLQKN